MKQQEEEKKNKRRAIWIAFFIHVIVIGLALIPFMRYSIKEDVSLTEAVEVMVFDFSKKEGASAKARPDAPAETPKEAPTPPPAEEVFKIEPMPVPKVVTTDAPEKVKLPEPSMPKIKETPTPTPTTTNAPEAETASPNVVSDTPSDAPSGNNQQGTSANEGNADMVEGEGKGSRYDGLDLSGDGVLSRRIIERATLDHLIKTDGVFVINICVNQRGNVVGAKYNKELSTIDDNNLVRKAIEAAMKYRFETDYSAPAKECGRMSITIKGTQ
jgi:hypothetical protein